MNSREWGGEERQQAEEEESAWVIVGSAGADEGDSVWMWRWITWKSFFFFDHFSFHGDKLENHLICSGQSDVSSQQLSTYILFTDAAGALKF